MNACMDEHQRDCGRAALYECAAAKSSYGPQNEAGAEGELMNGSCYFSVD